MPKHKNIPVKSYYQRARVFGYMVLAIALTVLIIYLIEKFG
ncbi:MAG: hypothetical protein OJF59_001725 [Cytophagales bacterium]|jgi:flagellar biogenesis protein FliO|nr:MAG: hypothetical protein OJF59_001725 [Cytophagales bacterium]